jgi:acetoacetate decarboxylase
MIVGYDTSGVGAYKELLFIPALFDFDKKKAFNISKIYVSTEESVYNGIENWGIPKQLANFNIQQTSSQTCQCKVNHQDLTFHIFKFGCPSLLFVSLHDACAKERNKSGLVSV